MNTKTIRKALLLARGVIQESVMAHPLFDTEFKGRLDRVTHAMILRFAKSRVKHYDDCEAFVAVCKAIKELDGEEKQ